jgi:hypothetical protein
MMDVDEKIRLLEVGLARAADLIGDVTAPAMERFYSSYPDARESFKEHGGANARQLEGEMVERTIYCLMDWLERRAEVEILLFQSVPHHIDTLNVRTEWYRGLIDAVIDVIAATIPPENNAELTVWNEIRHELGDMIERSRREFSGRLHEECQSRSLQVRDDSIARSRSG